MAGVVRPVAFGRPGTQVIPTGWSAAHRPVVDGTRTSRCTVRKPGTIKGAFNDVTGTYAQTARPPYAGGMFRIQVLALAAQDTVTGEEQVPSVGYLVTGPVYIHAAPGDLVHVVDAGPNGDPSLTGRDLVVKSVTRGSLAWERDLHCIDHLN